MKRIFAFTIVLLTVFSLNTVQASVFEPNKVQDYPNGFPYTNYYDLLKPAGVSVDGKNYDEGEFYFTGLAPEQYGHGMGMSQWGAFGAALRGWDRNQILTYYYKDTVVESRGGRNISVIGYGTMNIEDYIAGVAETPTKACGNQNSIDQWKAYSDMMKWAPDDPKRDKYKIDDPNSVVDCWPEEAIKAQAIASRSYAATHSQPICTTTYCQVYKGNKEMAWAAYETEGKYVISKGYTGYNQIISAMYSANNSNGTGTANMSTIQADLAGNGGNNISYLQSVVDASLNFDYAMFRKVWKTSSFNILEINHMLHWCAGSSSCPNKDWVKDNVANRIGTLNNIVGEKELSGRVKKVRVYGNLGSAEMSGLLFTKVFNSWQDSMSSDPNRDQMRSTSFSINTVAPTNTVPVYRFWSTKLNANFYTIDEAEKDRLLTDPTLKEYWQYTDAPFRAYANNLPGNYSIHRFWSPILTTHFYTADVEEINRLRTDPRLKSYWNYEGVAFYGFISPVGYSRPIYRYWSPNMYSHFFAMTDNDRTVLNNDPTFKHYWTYEKIAFYLYSNP